jgi:hypothetical protein
MIVLLTLTLAKPLDRDLRTKRMDGLEGPLANAVFQQERSLAVRMDLIPVR